MKNRALRDATWACVPVWTAAILFGVFSDGSAFYACMVGAVLALHGASWLESRRERERER